MLPNCLFAPVEPGLPDSFDSQDLNYLQMTSAAEFQALIVPVVSHEGSEP